MNYVRKNAFSTYIDYVLSATGNTYLQMDVN